MVTLATSAARVVHMLARALAVLSLLGMVFVMVMIVYEVIVRQTGQPGITGYVEYVEVAMAIAVFFALGETERTRAHVSVDLLAGRLHGMSYRVVRIAAGVLAAVVALLLAWASWEVLADSVSRGEYKLGLVSIPMWPARTAVFAGFLVLALEQVISAVEDIVDRDGRVEDDPALSGHGI